MVASSNPTQPTGPPAPRFFIFLDHFATTVLLHGFVILSLGHGMLGSHEEVLYLAHAFGIMSCVSAITLFLGMHTPTQGPGSEWCPIAWRVIFHEGYLLPLSTYFWVFHMNTTASIRIIVIIMATMIALTLTIVYTLDVVYVAIVAGRECSSDHQVAITYNTWRYLTSPRQGQAEESPSEEVKPLTDYG